MRDISLLADSYYLCFDVLVKGENPNRPAPQGKYATTEGTRGICPSGWHIPTKEDWEILQEYLNDEATKLIDKNAKSGSTYTNESGFSALFSGYSNSIWVCCYGLGYYGYQWTSTETSNRNAYGIFMSYNYDNISFNYDKKNNGLAIRCIKD